MYSRFGKFASLTRLRNALHSLQAQFSTSSPNTPPFLPRTSKPGAVTDSARLFRSKGNNAPNLDFSSRRTDDSDIFAPSLRVEDHIPILVVTCLQNNTFIVCRDGRPRPHLIFKLSAGAVGYKGAAKMTEEATLTLSDRLFEKLREKEIREIRLEMRGMNYGRAVLLSQIRKSGVVVRDIVDTTGVPYNGCRPKKARRV